jgi:hypothetical protein
MMPGSAFNCRISGNLKVVTVSDQREADMKQLLCGLLTAGLLFSSVAAAQTGQDQLQLKQDHPTEHVVVKGDTLWDISGHFLNRPWRWPEIWGVNPQIDNPHLIYPGDVIYLTWVDGQPRLGLRPGDGRLSPQVREMPLEQAIPAISLRDINSFISDNLVVQDDVLEQAPYVVGGDNRRLITGAGDRAYARGKLVRDDRNQAVYRPAREYFDPVTGEFLGYELFKVADAVISAVQEDVISLDLQSSNEEVRATYRVLPTEETRIQSMFYPKPAPDGQEGLIIGLLKGVSSAGQYDAVVLNVGQREQIEPGHVFSIYRTGETIRDPVVNDTVQLPSEHAGILMVFKSFDKVSYGLIMRATNVISVGDEIRNPS